MNEQTKLELLKIAAQLTIADSNVHKSTSAFGTKYVFERHLTYLFKNIDRLKADKIDTIQSRD